MRRPHQHQRKDSKRATRSISRWLSVVWGTKSQSNEDFSRNTSARQWNRNKRIRHAKVILVVWLPRVDPIIKYQRYRPRLAHYQKDHKNVWWWYCLSLKAWTWFQLHFRSCCWGKGRFSGFIDAFMRPHSQSSTQSVRENWNSTEIAVSFRQLFSVKLILSTKFQQTIVQQANANRIEREFPKSQSVLIHHWKGHTAPHQDPKE